MSLKSLAVTHNSRIYSQLFLNGHLHKTDTSIRQTLFVGSDRTLLVGSAILKFYETNSFWATKVLVLEKVDCTYTLNMKFLTYRTQKLVPQRIMIKAPLKLNLLLSVVFSIIYQATITILVI